VSSEWLCRFKHRWGEWKGAAVEEYFQLTNESVLSLYVERRCHRCGEVERQLVNWWRVPRPGPLVRQITFRGQKED
jgi:hypothetical protein